MLQKAEETQVVKYSVVEADIAQMKSIYMDLVITDLEDTEQFKQVKEARLIVKGKRCAVENERKALKADALAWGRKVDSEAKKIFAMIEPIETHLQNEEQKVIDEQERKKAEEVARQKAIIEERIKSLLAVEVVLSYIDVASMTDPEFDDLLMGKTLEFEERQKEKAEAEAKAKAEAEELAKQKAEQEAEAKKLAEEKAKLEAEAKAIQDEKDRLESEKKRQQANYRIGCMEQIGFRYDPNVELLIYEDYEIKLETVMDEADNTFKAFISEQEEMLKSIEFEIEQEAKEKAEREKKAAEERAKREVEEKARQEALKPDKQKLIDWIEGYGTNPIPNIESEEVAEILRIGLECIQKALDDMLYQVKNL